MRAIVIVNKWISEYFKFWTINSEAKDNSEMASLFESSTDFYVHKQLGKDNNYREMSEISDKFGVVASTAYEKVNTTGTVRNLSRLVPVPGHGAQIKLELGHQQKAVQTAARTQTPHTGTQSENVQNSCK